MKTILPIDEINRLSDSFRKRFLEKTLKGVDVEDIIDEMLDLFLLAYSLGNNVTNEKLNSNWKPSTDDVDKTVNAEVAGKTWKERVKEYFSSGGNVEDIIRILDTEAHRISNTAAIDTAVKAGAKTKRWVTMLDERVRDTHQYLEGVKVGINEDFYTYDGDHSPAPGLFSLPENNVNCRCELEFGMN